MLRSSVLLHSFLFLFASITAAMWTWCLCEYGVFGVARAFRVRRSALSGWRRLGEELVWTLGLLGEGAGLWALWTHSTVASWVDEVLCRRPVEVGFLTGAATFLLAVSLSPRLRSDIAYDVHRRHMRACLQIRGR